MPPELTIEEQKRIFEMNCRNSIDSLIRKFFDDTATNVTIIITGTVDTVRIPKEFSVELQVTY